VSARHSQKVSFCCDSAGGAAWGHAAQQLAALHCVQAQLEAGQDLGRQRGRCGRSCFPQGTDLADQAGLLP